MLLVRSALTCFGSAAGLIYQVVWTQDLVLKMAVVHAPQPFGTYVLGSPARSSPTTIR